MWKRIAISVTDSLQGDMQVAEHFGRCLHFMVYDVDDQKKVVKEESFLNPLLGQHSGACDLPCYLKELGANVIIAGGMGQQAIANFNKFDIEVVTAPGAKIVDVIYSYLQGELPGYEPCTAHKGNYHG